MLTHTKFLVGRRVLREVNLPLIFSFLLGRCARPFVFLFRTKHPLAMLDTLALPQHETQAGRGL
jgi:hypothetical protein